MGIRLAGRQVSGGAQAGHRSAFQPDRICHPSLLRPHESLGRFHTHFPLTFQPLPLGCQASPLLTPPAYFCPSLQTVGHQPPGAMHSAGAAASCSVSPAPPHPQDILKYTFSFLQLGQGGSQPQNRADQRGLQPQWGFSGRTSRLRMPGFLRHTWKPAANHQILISTRQRL